MTRITRLTRLTRLPPQGTARRPVPPAAQRPAASAPRPDPGPGTVVATLPQ